ncbi:MAG: hypothetical protein NZT92_18255 [Abditibacteriales bacterium]|nr:hypothetical protein [Abditibacteriales bacterium]MDW8367755.1 RING finger protein [Abditibacteriales bacterium]
MRRLMHRAGISVGFLFSVFLYATGWGQNAAPSRVSGRGMKTLRLFVNGSPVDKTSRLDFVPPFLSQGTVFIPLHVVFPSYTQTISGKTLTLTAHGKRFELTEGERQIAVTDLATGARTTPFLSAPVRMMSETENAFARFMAVPADFFAQAFDREAVVNQVEDKVYIMLPPPQALAPASPPLPAQPEIFAPSSPPHQPPYESSAATGMGVVLMFILSVVLIVGIALAVRASQHNALNNAYRLFAQRVGGTLTEGSLWKFPSVTFAHDGASASLGVYATGGKNSTLYTQLTFTLPHNSSFRCEISPQGFLQEIGKFFGLQDIEVGYRPFDDHFIVKSDDVETVRTFLNAAVQRELIKLKQLRHNNHIDLSMNSSRLLIQKLSLLNRLEDLIAFYESSGRICDEVMTLLGVGGAGIIQILDVSFDGAEVTPVCQICGEELTWNKVVCRRCRTPHHRDCWEYNGGCSVYGCKERRYIVSK